ncbi:MAG: PAS domain-containing protein, partial [Methanolinea sp.]
EFICRFDPDFRLTFANGALCKYMGWVAGEVPGKDILEYVHPEDREMVRERTLSLGPGRDVETHEQRIISPGGETRWHLWTHRAILDGSGRIVEYQGVGRDITEKRLSEERLRVLDMAVSSSVNGVVIATLDGRITYANAAFLKMIGDPPGDAVIGQPLRTLFPAGTAGERLDGAPRLLLERGEWNGEVLIPRGDGRTVHAFHTANLVRDAAGNPIAMMASFTDISERIEAEREIRIRNAAIESATNAIVIFDPDDRLVYANRVFLSLFGARDLRDMQENHMGEFWNLTRYFTPSLAEIRREVSRSGAWNGEIRIGVGEGKSRFFQSSLTLVRDEAGMPASYIGVFMETTAQKAMEKALRTTYEKIQEAAEFMPDPTFILGRDRRVIAWNRAMEVLSGVRKEEVLGSDRYREALSFLKGTMPVLVDILGLPAHELARNHPSVRKFGDSLYAEATIPGSAGGTERYIWAKASPLFDGEGNIVGAIESFRDISGWKRARESLAVQGSTR